MRGQASSGPHAARAPLQGTPEQRRLADTTLYTSQSSRLQPSSTTAKAPWICFEVRIGLRFTSSTSGLGWTGHSSKGGWQPHHFLNTYCVPDTVPNAISLMMR